MRLASHEITNDVGKIEFEFRTSPSRGSNLNIHMRRALIGLVSGLIGGVVLVAALQNVILGLVLGATVGILYAVGPGQPTQTSVENVFTAASLGVPLWAMLNVILFPVMTGQGPQWD